jgi:hypothetical protein
MNNENYFKNHPGYNDLSSSDLSFKKYKSDLLEQ